MNFKANLRKIEKLEVASFFFFFYFGYILYNIRGSDVHVVQWLVLVQILIEFVKNNEIESDQSSSNSYRGYCFRFHFHFHRNHLEKVINPSLFFPAIG